MKAVHSTRCAPFLVLLAAALVGLSVSAGLWMRQSGGTLAWLDALCSRGGSSGCAAVERSPLAAPFGVPLALFGVLFYAGLVALAFTSRLHGAQPFLGWALVLAALGLVVDAGLLSYSLFELGTVCGLCALTYLATLVALLATLWALRGGSGRLVLHAHAAPAGLGFLAAAWVALVASAASVEERAAGAHPADFATDPDRALRLAWDAFREHYSRTEVQPIDTRAAPRKGAEQPVLELVLFADFACPYCQRAAQVLGEFVERHREVVALVFLHYPLDPTCNAESEPIHPGACALARAAESARRQGRFWPFAERLFANRELWARGVSPTQISSLASADGLELATFEMDLSSPSVSAVVQADLAQAEALGVTGTPTLFVNGRRMPSIPIPTFLEELLLAEAEERAGFASAPRALLGARE